MQTLIPSARFGAVLSSHRRERGLDVVELAGQSHGAFTATQLADAERGRIPNDDATRSALAALYQLDTSAALPKRSELIVDLDGRQLAVGDQSVVVRSDEVDHVLERYLSLLYLLRDARPGTELSLRDPDLDVLSNSLEIELAALERRLGQLMVGEDVPRLLSRLRSRILLPAAGVLVAACAVGSFVIIGSPNQTVEQVDAAGFVASVVAPATSVSAIAAPASLVADSGQHAQTSGRSQSSEWASYHAQAVRAEAGEPAVSGIPDADDASIADRTPENELAAVVGAEGKALQTADTVTDSEEPDADGDQPTPTGIGGEALALLSYDWQAALPGWIISFVDAGDTDARGMTYPRDKAIVVYVHPGDTPERLSEIAAHELGHALDVEHLDDSDRMAWLNARGKPLVWWAGSGLTDFDVGAGDFAEAVAAEWTGSSSRSGEFSDADLELVRQLLP